MVHFILRFTGGGSVPVSDLKQIRSFSGLTVVDDSMPKMMLVQATPQTIGQLSQMLPGWESSVERLLTIPDTKRKLKRSV